MEGKKQRQRNPIKDLMELESPVRMSICSNREVIFEGSRGILEYCENSVKLNTGAYIVAFTGRGLRILGMNESELTIRGYITSIEYIM